MKFVAKLRAIFRVSTLLSFGVLSVQPLKAQVPNPGVPDFIYQTQGEIPISATQFRSDFPCRVLI